MRLEGFAVRGSDGARNPVKCSERPKRMEASCFVASLLARRRGLGVGARARAVLLGLALGLLLLGVGCAPQVGSVGAVLGKDVNSGRLYVREVAPAMGAAAAGVRDGDEVIAIDGEPVGDMSPREVHTRLRGGVGTKVVLLIVREGVTRKVEVQRGPLEN